MHGVDWPAIKAQVPAARRAGDRPRGAERRPGADGRRAVGAAHLRPRRRPPRGAGPGDAGLARRAARAGRGGGRLPGRAHLPVGPRPARAPGAAGAPRRGRRRRATSSRRSTASPTLSVADVGEPAAQPGRQAGAAAGEAEGGRRGARRDRRADHAGARERAALRRVGVHAAPGGREGGPGQDRLRAPARDGRRRHRAVVPRVLPGLQPRRPDHRRPPQPRRQHRQLGPRAAAAQGVVLLAAARRPPDLEHAVRLPRPRGRAVRRVTRPPTARRSPKASAASAWAR